MDKLVEFFCDFDDFCYTFIPQREQQCIEDNRGKRRRHSHMSAAR
ncbi:MULTISPECIES: hypothetical protein [Photorhabdus]|uniref:Transposase, is4 family n=1 Tax=Photorhabdus asymbiotica subsp. asymbiotica (strain ATCC 43949 / 3105-77) TaxID=553480 RepID=C7BRM6_PHOAA|nr:hypothetical protein [Photorhabdus asymbiotica]CAQ83427.1 transposase, is4 family [Photorhabdus asymbiotica]